MDDETSTSDGGHTSDRLSAEGNGGSGNDRHHNKSYIAECCSSIISRIEGLHKLSNREFDPRVCLADLGREVDLITRTPALTTRDFLWKVRAFQAMRLFRADGHDPFDTLPWNLADEAAFFVLHAEYKENF